MRRSNVYLLLPGVAAIASCVLLTANAQIARTERRLDHATREAEGKDKETAPLNPKQALFLKYWDCRFAPYLDRSVYARLPDNTKDEIAKFWLGRLERSLPVLQLGTDDDYPTQYIERFEAINILAAIHRKDAVARLLEIATENLDKDNRDRWMAVRALGLIGDKSVIPKLIHVLYHENMNARIWGQISLVRLTGQNFGSDWQRWGEWWNSTGQSPRFEANKIDSKMDSVKPEEYQKAYDPMIQKKFEDLYIREILKGDFKIPTLTKSPPYPSS